MNIINCVQTSYLQKDRSLNNFFFLCGFLLIKSILQSQKHQIQIHKNTLILQNDSKSKCSKIFKWFFFFNVSVDVNLQYKEESKDMVDTSSKNNSKCSGK